MVQTHSVAPQTRLTTSPNYHWWVTASVMLGTFIVIVDGMIVNIALPKIMSSFGVDVLTIRWVATSYMLASAVMESRPAAVRTEGGLGAQAMARITRRRIWP